MKTHHIVTVKELRELETGDFNLLLEGYDAENMLNFVEIVHFVNCGQVRGLCIDPNRTKLSVSCRSFIKASVINSVNEYKEMKRG